MKNNNKIANYLEESIKNKVPDCILLSGGIDSSSIAYFARKFNPNVAAITIAMNGARSQDVKYAKLVVKRLKIKHHYVVKMHDYELSSLLKKSVVILGNFNTYWNAASIVLLRGIIEAKKMGFKVISTGEGSDDLFGSFPVMLNWEYSQTELKDFIDQRMKDIDIMTTKIAESMGVDIAMPFHDKKLKKYSLSLPMNLRTRKISGEKITKYLLRQAMIGLLPDEVVHRPQVMAFTGASTLDKLFVKYGSIDNKKLKNKFGLIFANSFEAYLFNILIKNNLFHPTNGKKTCLYCHSKLRSIKSVHCPVCGTLQYKNKILLF